MTETQILLDAADLLNDEIRKAFQEQGHHLTGLWEKSLSATSYAPGTVEGVAKSYGNIVDAGTLPDRIPYGGSGNGNGGTSQYIQGLFRFWKLRKPGCSDKEALSLAFATAKKQKKEGMSTNASRAYSSTGERQKFVEVAFAHADEKVSEFVLDGMTGLVNAEVPEARELTY